MSEIRARLLSAIVGIAMAATLPLPADVSAKDDSTLADTVFLSITTLEHQMLESANRRIPENLRNETKCVAVFPAVVEAGLILASEKGNGLVTCRHPTSGEWGAPAAFSVSATSVGIQAGIQSASYVLLFMDDGVVAELVKSELKFGESASISAGPVGAAVSGTGNASVLSYVRTAGLFAGVDLGGARITYSDEANAELYGSAASAESILFETTAVPMSLEPFHATLTKFAPAR